MGTPSWLYYLFGIVMLGVAAYALALFSLSLRLNDTAGRDIDIAHLSMGVAMAGMFVPHWAFWPSWFWETVFFVLMVWFIVRSAQSLQRFSLHVPHEGVHAAMSLAMVLMYLYPAGASAGAMSMSMSSSSHGILDPGVSLVLAFMFFGSAIFTLASPVKGASHHGSHRRLQVRSLVAASTSLLEGTEDAVEPEEAMKKDTIGLQSGLAAIASPRLEDLSHVIMCLGMGFMLILML